MFTVKAQDFPRILESDVFTADPKVMMKVRPLIERVLIIDPNMAAAKLLGEILKGMGAQAIVFEQDERRALELAREENPQIVFTERAGPRLDGEEFTRRLRRSNLPCRYAPVIMVTGEATASTIKGARDAGVHEFLRKPFTAADLFRRIENVALKPRDWVEAVGYVGPDRRRFNSGGYEGPRKRRADATASLEGEAAAARDQALRILKAALAQFDSDPAQAVRAMRQQAQTLKAQAVSSGDASLAVAASELATLLCGAGVTAALLEAPVTVLLRLADATPLARAG